MLRRPHATADDARSAAASVMRERPRVRVAYQGEPGAFGEEAVRRAWRGGARAVPVRTFVAALESLVAGAVERSVVPWWNSIIGPVAAGCAALDAFAGAIVRVREVEVPVRQCLLALPGTSMRDVQFVGSHPAALAQCTRLFGERGTLVPCAAFDTAGAARELSELEGVTDVTCRAHHAARGRWYSPLGVDSPAHLAVIAGAGAARRYGLVVLRQDVHDDPGNVTRFVVVRARRMGDADR